jgi:IS66 Orf2 like protein
MLVQEELQRDPFGGQIFVFRGRRGYLIKALWWDGQGLCLYAKRLEKGRFVSPSPAHVAAAGRRIGASERSVMRTRIAVTIRACDSTSQIFPTTSTRCIGSLRPRLSMWRPSERLVQRAKRSFGRQGWAGGQGAGDREAQAADCSAQA